MQILLRGAYNEAHLAQEGPDWLKPNLSALIERKCVRIVADGLVYHEAQLPLEPRRQERRGRSKKRTGLDFLLRLYGRRGDVRRLLNNHDVTFTSNHGEQDGQMI